MLQPGDVLMFRVDDGAPLIDRLIAWGERMLKQSNADKKNYYHVGFVSADPRKYYESKPPRICLTDVPQPLPDYVEVYRPLTPLTPDQLKKIFTYANSKIGTLYNFLGVLTAGYVQIGQFMFCSQFTWVSYSQASFYFCPYEFLESPDDIPVCPPLVLVPQK